MKQDRTPLRRPHVAVGARPGGIEMFLLSVLFMTAWMFAVVTGFAGGFAHLLGVASVAMIVMRRETCHLRPHSEDSNRPATI